jgi:hypothetical protein
LSTRGTPSEPRPDNGERHGLYAARWAAIASIVTCLVTTAVTLTATGAFGGKKDDTGGAAPTTTVTVAGPTVTVTRTVTAAPSDAGTTGTEAASSDPGATRKASKLKLALYESFDLDSTAGNWGKATSISDGSSAGNDLLLTQFGAGGLQVPEQRAVRVSGTPDPAKCDDPTAESAVGYIFAGNEQGKSFCYKTNENRVVWLTVRTYAIQTYTVTVDVVVWRTPVP